MLNSCSSNQEKGIDQGIDPSLFYSINRIQFRNLEECNNGNRSYYELQDMAMDRSDPGKVQKVKSQLEKVKEIDAICKNIFKKVEDAKIELFKSIGEQVNTPNAKNIVSIPYSERNPLSAGIYNLKQVKYSGQTKILGVDGKLGNSLMTSMIEFRKNICELLVSSAIINEGNKPYFFNDPQIESFKDYNDLVKQLDKAIDNSNVSYDDMEALKKIYISLSHTKEEWSEILSGNMSWLTAFAALCTFQHEVLLARTNALSLIRSRVGGSDIYGFNKLEAIVVGPGVAHNGEDIVFEVIMGALNEDNQPLVEVSGGAKVVEVKNGRAYLTTNIGNAKEINLKGTISIRNKSGIPIILPWSKKIVAIP